VPGKGKFTYTGQLGDVMQESIQAAMTVVRSRAEALGIDPDFHQKMDVHIHVPKARRRRTVPVPASRCARRWFRADQVSRCAPASR
jgi:ATP-dependent Lon protease